MWSQLIKAVLASLLLSVVGLALIVALTPPTDDFSPDNPYWNGLSTFKRVFNASFVNVASLSANPRTGALFIIGPSKNASYVPIETIKNFVAQGGVLVLMDESGAINSMLKELGVGVEVVGYQLCDAVYFYKSWRLPRIIDVSSSSLTEGVEEIVMNVPSALKVEGRDVKVLAYSSYFSYLDEDGDCEPDEGEEAGPFPVVAEVKLGDGRIIIISDSSIPMNSVIELGDNLRLLKGIVGDRETFVDTSLWIGSVHSELKSLLTSIYSYLLMPELKYTIVATLSLLAYRYVSRVRRAEVDELDEVLKKHPDWDYSILKALKEAREDAV